METHDRHILIDTTPADIRLADFNELRPYIYVAFDESGKCLAIEGHEMQTPTNKIDFINQAIRKIEVL